MRNIMKRPGRPGVACVLVLVLAAVLSVETGRPAPAHADAGPGLGQQGGKGGESVTLPLIGQVDPLKTSLPVFTVVVAAVDGFNPCAFFVLLFLLSLLVHAGSRKRMLVIGGTFVFFSGLVYFLFMSAWLNVFLLIGNLRAMTTAAGIIALTVAAVNIKDFFVFGKGFSLSIPDWAKPRLFERMRGLIRSASTPSMLAGVIVLSAAANSYEFLCTAGFPMVFTRVLTLHGLSASGYYLYLALYNAVYIVPLAVIVVLFSTTLGARKLTERQGRVLKLVSGTMMLGMGIVLLVNPALLGSAATALLLLAAALAAAGMIAVLFKKTRQGPIKAGGP